MDTPNKSDEKKKVQEIQASEADTQSEPFLDEKEENQMVIKVTNLLGNYSEQTGASFG